MGAPEPLISGLSAAGLLPPEDTPWSEPSRWLVDAARALVAQGMDPTTVVRLAALGRDLGLLESRALVSDVAHSVSAPEALARESGRRKALTRFVAAVRYAAVSGTMRRLTALSEPFQAMAAEQLHVPSTLFLEERGLSLAEEELRARAAAGAADGPWQVGRFLMATGRYAEAARWLDQAAGRAGEASVLAHLAVCRAFLGETTAARLAIQTALGVAPDRAVVLAFAGVVRAYFAGQAEDVVAASTAVTEALDFLERSRRAAPGDPVEALETQLARGRIASVLPADFGIHRLGLDDLRGVLRASATLQHPDTPPGIVDIFRLHAAYFLSSALLADREPGPEGLREAHDALREVVLIDPACALAERAYRRLGELSIPAT